MSLVWLGLRLAFVQSHRCWWHFWNSKQKFRFCGHLRPRKADGEEEEVRSRLVQRLPAERKHFAVINRRDAWTTIKRINVKIICNAINRERKRVSRFIKRESIEQAKHEQRAVSATDWVSSENNLIARN